MKYLLFILLAGSTFGTQAQVNNTAFPPRKTITSTAVYTLPQFNTRRYELEDHWVVASKNEATGKYVFGFIYLDPMAGFTFNLEGSFGYDAQGHVYRDSSDYLTNAMYKVRLGPNTKLMYPMPDNMLKDLGVKQIPDWLATYQHGITDKNSVAYKVQYGKHLNSAGAPQKALVYLEDAYKAEPHAAGLEFELTYSYNELGQFDKSITILKSALTTAPDNALFYRELGYAYMKSNNMDDAIKTYIKGISVAKLHDGAGSRMEMVQNLSLVYGQQNQNDKAIALINETITDVPNSVPLYVLLATTYLKAGDADNAITTYTKAIDISKPQEMESKAQLAYSIALIYRNQKKDMALYNEWGKKAKDWAPANSRTGQGLKNLVF